MGNRTSHEAKKEQEELLKKQEQSLEHVVDWKAIILDNNFALGIVVAVVSGYAVHRLIAYFSPKEEDSQKQRIGSGWQGWEKEVKRNNSYYYGHNRVSDGLTQEDYQMNGPRLLAKTTSSESPRAATPVKNVGKRIDKFSFGDEEETAKVYIEGDLSGVQKQEVSAEVVDGSGLSIQIDSAAAYGQRHLRIRKLFAPAASVRIRKLTAARLVVEIKKSSAGEWTSLAAKP